MSELLSFGNLFGRSRAGCKGCNGFLLPQADTWSTESVVCFASKLLRSLHLGGASSLEIDLGLCSLGPLFQGVGFASCGWCEVPMSLRAAVRAALWQRVCGRVVRNCKCEDLDGLATLVANLDAESLSSMKF